MRIPITRYGQPQVTIFTLALLAGAAAAVVWLHWSVGVIVCAVALMVVLFFRDPTRSAPEGDGLVVAPADGKVVEIADVTEDQFLGCPAKRISIFLSLFDVHLNRAPAAGRVAYQRYVPGRFLAAFRPDAGRENERNFVGLEDVEGRGVRLLVVQIAGVIARRIVSRARPGLALGRGEAFGMIKFGSRTELYIPVASLGEIRVKVGDKVRAGSDVVGVLK
jgi:phosphatidylserine decarboxylase